MQKKLRKFQNCPYCFSLFFFKKYFFTKLEDVNRTFLWFQFYLIGHSLNKIKLTNSRTFKNRFNFFRKFMILFKINFLPSGSKSASKSVQSSGTIITRPIHKSAEPSILFFRFSSSTLVSN